VVDPHGVSRWPVQPVEVAFHALAFAWLFVRAKSGRANGLDLVAYLACYGAVRFALEFVRWHPALWLGLTWYQWLSVALVLPSAGLWLRRLQASHVQAADQGLGDHR
jgi:prolipoprotein diacylglyceryltransferase